MIEQTRILREDALGMRPDPQRRVCVDPGYSAAKCQRTYVTGHASDRVTF